ncbi:MAG: hypothetical protein ACREBG_17545 [Pyrinomonadaceae bacterium]
MKLTRLLTIVSIVLLATVAWVWWNRPQTIDMAQYAPADALIYLECNSLLDIAEGIVSTDAWRAVSPVLGKGGGQPGPWLRRLVSWTGIGPTQSVILARAQVATVMLDLGAKEQGETLTIRPEAAILIETHTTERRMRPTVEEALRQFAEKAYPAPALQKKLIDGSEFTVWSAAGSDHQVVAAIEGSLVIVGNSERAVKACLDVRRGLRPSLSNDREMQQLRQRLSANHALAFGFISSANAVRLVSTGAPLLFGRTPGDARFNQIFATSAAKALAGVGWSSHVSMGGIEDRYLFSLQPTLISRLGPLFRATDARSEAPNILPGDVHSMTIYKFENPVAAWQVFKTAVSAQLDTLSAIVFNSLLNASLASYGIEDPEKFLAMVGPEMVTARLTRDSERSVLIAQVRDEPALRKLLLGPSGERLKRKPSDQFEVMEIPGKNVAVSFFSGEVLIGRPEEVHRSIQAARSKQVLALSSGREKLEHFLPLSNAAGVVTYSRDDERVLNFFLTIARMNGSSVAEDSSALKSKIEALPYSVTETKMGDYGLERTTRSSLGQFATFVPLLLPER